jgi:hypothetical protein
MQQKPIWFQPSGKTNFIKGLSNSPQPISNASPVEMATHDLKTNWSGDKKDHPYFWYSYWSFLFFTS